MKSGSKLLFLVLMLASLTVTMSFARVALSADDIPQISADDLKQMIESKKTDFLVIDVQPKGVYDISHVKGAINLPWAADLKSPGRLPRDKMLIFYCDCTHEEDSTSTATQVKQKFGYANVRTLKGGWSGWLKLGYPVDKK